MYAYSRFFCERRKEAKLKINRAKLTQGHTTVVVVVVVVIVTNNTKHLCCRKKEKKVATFSISLILLGVCECVLNNFSISFSLLLLYERIRFQNQVRKWLAGALKLIAHGIKYKIVKKKRNEKRKEEKVAKRKRRNKGENTNGIPSREKKQSTQSETGRKTFGVNDFCKGNLSRNKSDSYIINSDTMKKTDPFNGKINKPTRAAKKL